MMQQHAIHPQLKSSPTVLQRNESNIQMLVWWKNPKLIKLKQLSENSFRLEVGESLQ